MNLRYPKKVTGIISEREREREGETQKKGKRDRAGERLPTPGDLYGFYIRWLLILRCARMM